ncbi:hypothetical protein P8452_42345 [Trifolium repens]|nr:hypothetical protein P8452_42345 [Trifolium repens]
MFFCKLCPLFLVPPRVSTREREEGFRRNTLCLPCRFLSFLFHHSFLVGTWNQLGKMKKIPVGIQEHLTLFLLRRSIESSLL